MPPRKGPPKRYKQQTLLSHFSSSPPPPSRPRRTGDISTARSRATQRPAATASESDSSESDVKLAEVENERKPTSERKQATLREDGPQYDSDSSDVGKIRFESRASSSQKASSSDEGPLPSSSQTTRARALNSVSDSSEAEKPLPRRIKTRRRIEELHSSDDESPPKRSRLTKRQTVESEGDNADADIMDGIDEDKIISCRLRQPTKKSKFKENLEKLKKKKQGIWAMNSSESESEVSANEDEDILPGARPDNDNSDDTDGDDNGSDLQNDVDDFIVEDDGDPGAAASLPAAFSMSSHQDLVHHFKVICQYYVHLAVTTDRSRKRRANKLTKDNYFSVPLTIAKRKISDLRDSIVSSVWRPDFTRSMLRYPVLNIAMLDFAVPQCDACHLGGRMSKYVGRMDGAPYDRETFERLQEDSSEEDSDPDSGVQEKPEFHLGRFCARRTQIYHQLSHWEYSLFRELLREVEELQNSGRGFVKVSYSGTVPPPDDTSDADQIMEWLDDRGIINEEWLKLKKIMADATNLESDVKRGGYED